MIMTGDIMVNALSEVTPMAGKENREQAGNAEEEESNVGGHLCAMLVLFIVGIIILICA